MANFSNTSLSLAEEQRSEQWFSGLHILGIFLLCIFVIGLLGNGIVIYLLGFHIQRNPFITYILNLAVADFGVLLFASLLCIVYLTNQLCSLLFEIVNIGATMMYVASQLLLTAISIDRCVSALFPIWYRCHRPTCWPTFVCAFMWLLASLPTGICAILHFLKNGWDCRWNSLFYPFIATAILCLPLVSVSSVVLLSKVFGKQQQPQKRRLLIIVSVTVLFFLGFAFPLSASYIINFFLDFQYPSGHVYCSIFACLNSCVNPVIYYAVGRKKRTQKRDTMKAILQRAFQEEKHTEEQSSGITMTTL